MKTVLFYTIFFLLFISFLNAQEFKSIYFGAGYNYSYSKLRGVNNFIDSYSRHPSKGGGYLMSEDMPLITSLNGHNIVIGADIDIGIVEINWTKKYNWSRSNYTDGLTYRDIAFRIRTFGLGYLHNIYTAPSINLRAFAGGHMDFVKNQLYTRKNIGSSEEVNWSELNIDNGNGNFSFISPTLKLIYQPIDFIPLSFAINFYWQMNWKNHDFRVLNDAIPNNWDNYQTLDSLKSSAGNVGVVFQVLLNPFGFKIPEKDKEQEPEPEPEISDIVIKGNVIDSASGNHINATMSVIKSDSYDIETEVIKSLNVAGIYKLNVPKAIKYKFKIEAFGYKTKEEEISFHDYNTSLIEKDFKLSKIQIGQAIKLENIYFKKASAELLPESFPELDKLYDFLEKNPSVEIEIAGHTSSEGSDSYNMDLSERRANSVKQYINNKGIKDNRITAKGYGEEKPVADNDTEKGRELNRRVEFVILKN